MSNDAKEFVADPPCETLLLPPRTPRFNQRPDHVVFRRIGIHGIHQNIGVDHEYSVARIHEVMECSSIRQVHGHAPQVMDRERREHRRVRVVEV